MRTRDDLVSWLRKMPKWVIYAVLIFAGITALPLACWDGIKREWWPEFSDAWEAIGEIE